MKKKFWNHIYAFNKSSIDLKRDIHDISSIFNENHICDITSRFWCVDDVLCKMVSVARKALFCGRGFNALVDELKALWHSSQTVVVWDPTQIVINGKCTPTPTTTTIIKWCVGWLWVC